MERRRFLGVLGSCVTASFSTGCLGGENTGGQNGEKTSSKSPDGVTVVEAGPEGKNLKFVPEEVSVEVGQTVRWVSRSRGHNVVCDPQVTQEAQLPGDAEPFKSYEEGSSKFTPIPQGESYEHTFETPGEYVYVCVPHLKRGMVGKVTVRG